MRGDDSGAATDPRRRTSFPSTTTSLAAAAAALALILVSSSVSAAASSDDDVIYGDDGGVKFRRFVFYLAKIMSRPLVRFIEGSEIAFKCFVYPWCVQFEVNYMKRKEATFEDK